jgi:hypothetical protein
LISHRDGTGGLPKTIGFPLEVTETGRRRRAMMRSRENPQRCGTKTTTKTTNFLEEKDEAELMTLKA